MFQLIDQARLERLRDWDIVGIDRGRKRLLLRRGEVLSRRGWREVVRGVAVRFGATQTRIGIGIVKGGIGRERGHGRVQTQCRRVLIVLSVARGAHAAVLDIARASVIVGGHGRRGEGGRDRGAKAGAHPGSYPGV